MPVFAGTAAGSVTITTSFTPQVNSLTFNRTGYTITGGSLGDNSPPPA